jgi:steroid delta-isomerase-like uncharacterized protein
MPENYQAIVNLLVELWNTGNPEVAKQLYQTGAERSDPNQPQPARGPEEIARYVAAVRTGFPDFQLQVHDMVGQENRLALHWTCTGTQRGEFQGIAPTGQRITISGLSLERIENGQIAEDRVYFDRLTLFEQLGVSPEAQQTQASRAAG